MRTVGAAQAALIALVSIATAGVIAPGAGAQDGFENRSELVESLPTRLVFDLGVTDFDGDSDLDLYTTNHNDRGGLFANEDGGFVDRYTDVGLDQSPGFPYFEEPVRPTISEAGVFFFRTGGTDAAEGALVVHVNEYPTVEVSGSISFPFPFEVLDEDAADVDARFTETADGPRWVADFTTTGLAKFVIEPEQMAAPIEVQVDPPFPVEALFVGPRRVRPDGRRFTLQLRDRHGIAWADLNADGALDAFIVRGGLKGQLGGVRAGLIADELMLATDEGFVDEIGGSGLIKGTCRGREADPIDYNRDGRLDLFFGCQFGPPGLFRQRRDGTFADVSRVLNRVGVHADHYTWLDVDGDARDELLASLPRKLVVFRSKRRGERWTKLGPVPLYGRAPGKLAIADYDADRDPDLFSAAPEGNTLIVNKDGKLRARRPSRFGLPDAGSVGASWVDYDNDGDSDLHVLPQGMYVGKGGRRLRKTGLASIPTSTEDALASWFDRDGDGDRDLLVGLGEDGWRFELLDNLAASGHWLQVELSGERDAYPAAGASVTVKADGAAQTQWVGQSDGARYSRGHHRLYFGLGDADRVEKLKVTWPGGDVRKLRDVSSDRVIHVSF